MDIEIHVHKFRNGMNCFDEIIFGKEDIVRSDFVKSYIIEKMKAA